MDGIDPGADGSANREITVICFATVFFVIGLILPLFTVTYAPPGGTGTVAGHPIGAFVEKITGWQFATTATYSHVLLAMGAMLSLGVFRILATKGHGSRRLVSLLDYIHAFVHFVIAFGWLLLLGLAIEVGTPAMPPNGEPGILPDFQRNPFGPGGQDLTTYEIPHMTVNLGLGWVLLAIGVVIGLTGLWKKAFEVTVPIFVITLILAVVYHPAYDWITNSFLF